MKRTLYKSEKYHYTYIMYITASQFYLCSVIEILLHRYLIMQQCLFVFFLF